MARRPDEASTHFYDSIATEFDALMNSYDLSRRLKAVFDDMLGGMPLSGLRVLDVGCGTGEFTLLAQHKGANVISLDIGYRLLEVARGKGVLTPVVADALVLPFESESFDLVLSSECVEHTTNGSQAVQEMIRVLRPDGRLVLTCPNRAWRWLVVSATWLGLRPYAGIEEPPSWGTLEEWIDLAGGRILMHHGLHAVPFQLPLAELLLPRLDRLLAPVQRHFINQCLLAIKPDPLGVEGPR